jgi:integrase
VGEPYADTGDGRGGNPLSKAHATARAAAGISDFTPHDWRHHWASWMVMSGVDLYTLMRLGGWASLKMVQRYAAVSGEHMAQAVNKLR